MKEESILLPSAEVSLGSEEYIDPEDGLIHCSKCGDAKQMILENSCRISKTVRISCSCEQEMQKRQTQMQQEQERCTRIEILRSNGIPDELYRNYTFDSDPGVIPEILIAKGYADNFEQLEGSGGQRLDLAEYMAEHIYMYSSEKSRLTFRIVKPMISDVIDIFGMDVRFFNETDTHVDVSAKVTEEAMFQFAKRYAPDVLVLGPERLVERLREDVKKTLRAYGQKNGGKKHDI